LISRNAQYYTQGVAQIRGAKYNSRQFKFRSGALNLGKGDKRTFRGKVFKGSHGKTRPRKPKKPAKKPA